MGGDVSVQDAIIGEESWRGTDALGQVVDVHQEQGWSEDCSLWHSGCDCDGVRTFSFDDYFLRAVLEEGLDPAKGFPLDSVMLEF